MKITSSYFSRLPSGFELDFCVGTGMVDEWDTEYQPAWYDLHAERIGSHREYYLEGSLGFWAFRLSFRF